MGDLIDKNKILKKLGFENQWIFYDDRFQKFFNFVVENVNDVNTLTEYEILERESMIQRDSYLKNVNLMERQQDIEKQYPGLANSKYQNVTLQKQIISELEYFEKSYQELICDMGTTKNEINKGFIQLKATVADLRITEKNLLNDCETKAIFLEELLLENLNLNNEFKKCINKTQSPPLFTHHLPLDQYFLKCDLFLQYFQLYIKENFKLQEFSELGNYCVLNVEELASNLEILEKSIKHYAFKQIKEKAKVCAIQNLINTLDINQIHAISLVDITRETDELLLLNEHHFKSTYETLINDLLIHVGHRTKQRLELILYENTKEKLSRAFNRNKNEKRLTKIIYDGLINAELFWIAMQLDLNKINDHSDNSQQISYKTQSSLRRIKIMCSRKTINPLFEPSFICKQTIFENCAKLLKQPLFKDAKLFLFEYEKICRIVTCALRVMVDKKLYFDLIQKINELKNIGNILKPIVFDSPLQFPMFEHVIFLQCIFNIKFEILKTENVIRYLRSQFKDNISDRMDKDKFWRCNQLLWVWFITNPRRLFMAIEEIKNDASKSSLNIIQKSIGGLKRK